MATSFGRNVVMLIVVFAFAGISAVISFLLWGAGIRCEISLPGVAILLGLNFAFPLFLGMRVGWGMPKSALLGGLCVLFVILLPPFLFPFSVGCIPGDAKLTQSLSYWRYEAKPFSVPEHKISNGSATIVIINSWADSPLTITGINIGPVAYQTQVKLAKDEYKMFIIPGFPTGTIGTLYDFPLNITYKEEGKIKTQVGIKYLVGKYS